MRNSLPDALVSPEFAAMHLLLLRTTPHACIYHDTWNDWLFVDWMGELTLPAVQAVCLEIARCYQHRAYPRLLNSNAQVQGIPWEAGRWLSQEVMPVAHLVGITHLAWVCGSSLRAQALVQGVVDQVVEPTVTLFSQVDEAVSWLQHYPPEYVSGCAGLLRPAALQVRAIEVFTRHWAAPVPALALA